MAIHLSIFVFSISLLLASWIPGSSSFYYGDNRDVALVVCREPNGYEPHPNCIFYYQCSNGIPTLRSCFGDNYFNFVTLECDHPDNVEDCVGGTREPPTSTTPAPTCPPDGVDFIPKVGTCEEYIMCVQGTPFHLKCDVDKLFDPAEKDCVHKSRYECPYDE